MTVMINVKTGQLTKMEDAWKGLTWEQLRGAFLAMRRAAICLKPEIRLMCQDISNEMDKRPEVKPKPRKKKASAR